MSSIAKDRDGHFMNLALEQAKKSLEQNQFPVGTVIVCNDDVIALGHNRVEHDRSDLSHAEMNAISAVQSVLFENKRHCEIFTTLEPCLMCFGAMAHFRFKRLAVGAEDVLAGALKHTKHLEYYGNGRISEIVTGVSAEDSRRLIVEYTKQTGFREHLLASIK